MSMYPLGYRNPTAEDKHGGQGGRGGDTRLHSQHSIGHAVCQRYKNLVTVEVSRMYIGHGKGWRSLLSTEPGLDRFGMPDKHDFRPEYPRVL